MIDFHWYVAMSPQDLIKRKQTYVHIHNIVLEAFEHDWHAKEAGKLRDVLAAMQR